MNFSQMDLKLANGEEVMELARLIKSDDEMKAMRRSIFSCEKSMELMRNHFKPGILGARALESLPNGGRFQGSRVD